MFIFTSVEYVFLNSTSPIKVLQFSLHLCNYIFFSIKLSERGIIYLTVVKFLHTRGFMGIQHKNAVLSSEKQSSFSWDLNSLHLEKQKILC